jgi:hypothetical protein
MISVIKQFWKDLVSGEHDRYFTKPKLCHKHEKIYKIQTKEDYIFADNFWDIFHKYPFHICHITFGNRYILLPKTRAEIKLGRFFFELRFRVEK